MLKAISLFTGIGGLDFGFEAAGFDTVVAVEMDSYSCRTIRTNRDWAVIEKDINLVSSEEILKAGGLKAREADVLIGGPPCQPFSKSGYWARGDSLRLDDPRADTLTGYLRVVRDTLPKTFLLENVTGFAFKDKDEGLQYILKGIEQINRNTGANYEVSWRVINCAEYGVPQTRERVFLVGSREGQKFQFPEPTHTSPKQLDADPDLFSTNEPYRTAWDAIGDLNEIEHDDMSLRVGGKWGDLLPTIPEGENYLWHTNRKGGKPLFGWRTRYWSFLLKLSKTAPSWTIQAQPGASVGPFHWKSRRLTFEEMCRLQTFPDGLIMNEGRTEMQRMVGNAVPSLIAEVLARAIRTQLLDNPIESKLKLLPPKRINIPRPERAARLPKKYRELIGDHADHPGEGKGRRAVKKIA
ncbi:MAG: DNA cytosine methyltransferase [Candidatus Thiodiazotropha sp.]